MFLRILEPPTNSWRRAITTAERGWARRGCRGRLTRSCWGHRPRRVHAGGKTGDGQHTPRRGGGGPRGCSDGVLKGRCADRPGAGLSQLIRGQFAGGPTALSRPGSEHGRALRVLGFGHPARNARRRPLGPPRGHPGRHSWRRSAGPRHRVNCSARRSPARARGWRSPLASPVPASSPVRQGHFIWRPHPPESDGFIFPDLPPMLNLEMRSGSSAVATSRRPEAVSTHPNNSRRDARTRPDGVHVELHVPLPVLQEPTTATKVTEHFIRCTGSGGIAASLTARLAVVGGGVNSQVPCPWQHTVPNPGTGRRNRTRCFHTRKRRPRTSVLIRTPYHRPWVA